nr:hypothetical protein [Dechloromonas sp.]
MTTPANWRPAARAKLVRLKSEAEAHRAESQRLMQTCISMTQYLRTAEAELAELERRLPFIKGEYADQIRQEIEERTADVEQQRAALSAARERAEETRNAYGFAARLANDATDAALRIRLVTEQEAAA